MSLFFHHHWQNRPFLAIAFLRRFCQICASDHPVFPSLDFATIIFLQSKVVSLPSNLQPGGPDVFVYGIVINVYLLLLLLLLILFLLLPLGAQGIREMLRFTSVS
jgi:hypothetical protein